MLHIELRLKINNRCAPLAAPPISRRSGKIGRRRNQTLTLPQRPCTINGSFDSARMFAGSSRKIPKII
jgi:hypothetical protein